MRMKMLVVMAAVLGLQAGAWAQSTRPAVRPFSEVAAESFDEWDADDDGTLSSEEIDRLVVSPRYTQERAAALAAMKLVVRSTKVAPPPLTLDFVTNRSREPAGELLPSEQPNVPEPAGPEVRRPAQTRPPASLERRYQSALRKIRSAKQELFADGTPGIDTCRQGPLGSCFFVAGVGAFVNRDGEAIKRMIREERGETGDISFVVTFGDGKSVTIPALTDAQYGLTSSSGRDGRWLTVLEQAYGALRMQSRPAPRRTLEASDALARGGSLGTTLKALTGHAIDRMRLRAVAEKDPELADKAMAALVAAMKDNRLAGASTGTTTPLPPGINGRHAYAILGFEQESGMVKLWNPHGNDFRPKGEAGMESGYPTRAGVFRIPVGEFVRVFDSMVVETDRDASPDSARAPGRG